MIKKNTKYKVVLYLILGCLVLLVNPASAAELKELFKQASPSVVILHTFEKVPQVSPTSKERMTSVKGLGSGVIISKDGLIATASHVVQLADSVHVEFNNGKKVKGKVVASEPTADVALLKVDDIPDGITHAMLADSDKISIGDNIFVIGAPFGIGHSLTVGHVSGRRNSMNTSIFSDVEFFQTDAAINEGNSGGPMFNMNGEVIGIVSHILSKSGGFEGMGFAVTSNTAKHLLLEEKRIWSGVDIQILEGELAGIFQLPQTAGALVQRVADDSPGAKAGLKGGDIPAVIGGRQMLLGGDIILNIENTPVKDQQSFKTIKQTIARKKAGEKIRITVLRQGRKVNLSGTK